MLPGARAALFHSSTGRRGVAGAGKFKAFADRLGDSAGFKAVGVQQQPLAPASRKAQLQSRIMERIKERVASARKDGAQGSGLERAARDEEIPATLITLISEEGVVQEGTRVLAQVLGALDRTQYTLVLVDGARSPPACRVFSRKLMYERERMARKQRKESSRRQPRPQTIVVSDAIGPHDLAVKMARAAEMLAKGKRVTVVVESKARRNRASPDLRAQIGASVLAQLEPHAAVCGPPTLEPSLWSVLLQGKAAA
ncbi:hypothetical protein GGI02_003563 [Coemansia sp. RSA 2322]|nr:hypothetical protein GGI02_003563 [Coemansia sp. RSA 2322]